MKKNNWVYKVFFMTFILSIIFSTASNVIAYNSSLSLVLVILIIVILIGIVFDMIGASSLTSKESTFHAMNAKKIKGAKETISLIKNNVQVSSLCNDVIGDICGILSGGLGAVLAVGLASSTKLTITTTSIIISAFISAFTVGGKAIFKGVAIKNSDTILFIIGKMKHFFKIK